MTILPSGNPKIRAPFHWIGGKGNFKKTILQHLPKSEVFVEVFGGSGIILLSKHISDIEVFNDLDEGVVNLFRVLQDAEQNKALKRKVYYTPYSRSEFRKALEVSPEASPLERAWSFYVKYGMGFGGRANAQGDWGFSFAKDTKIPRQVSAWQTRKLFFQSWLHRLNQVFIENDDALKIIQRWDSEKTLFYLDPPYIHDTRTRTTDYRHDPDNSFHIALCESLLKIKGAAVLSGYSHSIYEPLLSNGWQKKDFQTFSHLANIRGGKRPGRTESLYISPLAQVWLKKDNQVQVSLLGIPSE